MKSGQSATELQPTSLASEPREPAGAMHVPLKELPIFDVEKIRRDFPILNQAIRRKVLTYLDNAASTQKPQLVIDTVRRFYEQEYANIHRGVYYLSERATEAYELARVKAQHFLNAADVHEIVFTRGTTESINLIAQSFGRMWLKPGDEILITEMEHHSNIVPWQMLSEAIGTKLKVIPMNDAGEISLGDVERMLTDQVRLVSIVHVSNVLGTINPVKEVIALAKEHGIPVVIDGAQAAPHTHVDVQALGCDFYAFSGHKLYGPTGVGVLYGKKKWLAQMPPYQGGGDMIESVTFAETRYKKAPYKFEAGTPNIAGTVGLSAAFDYIHAIGLGAIEAYEHSLYLHALERLQQIPEVRLIGTAENKTSLISFVIEGVHPHDAGTILDQDGIAIRAGHHCAQPVMEHYQVPATIRASFAFYNTHEEVEILAQGIEKVLEVFR